MARQRQTKEDLIREVEDLRERLAALEAASSALPARMPPASLGQQDLQAPLSDILESISDGFFVLDQDLVVTYFNRTAEDILNRPRRAVLGRPLFDAFPEARGSIFETRYNQALREKKPLSFETHFETPPYANWYEVRVHPFAKGISVFFQVTTARKEAEQEIRRLADFPHLNPNPVLEVDEEGQVLYANPAALQAVKKLGLFQGARAFLPPDLQARFAASRAGGDRHYNVDLALGDAVLAVTVFFPHDLSTARLYAMDITERKQAEEELRKSREDLNRAQAVAQTGSWRLNVQLNELTWSQESYRIFGIPLGTPLTYETFLAAVHPEDREYVDQKWSAALKGEPYDIEHRIVVDGAVHWVRERAELEFDYRGRFLGGFGTAQDITARKRAEEALKKSEARERVRAAELQAVLDAAPVAIAIGHDPDGRRITGNPAIYRLLGLPPGSNLSKLAPESEGPSFRVMQGGRELAVKELPVQRAIAGQTVRNLELDIALPDGVLRQVAASAVPLLDEAGQPRGAIAAFLDLTELKRAERGLRQAHAELEQRVRERTWELRFAIEQLEREIIERRQAEEELARHAALVQDLYNNAPCGYHSLDANGVFVQINQTELAWLGYTREEVLGRLKFSDLLTDEGKQAFKGNFSVFKERGWARDLEYEMVRKDGTILPVILNATAVKDEDGRFLMSRGIIFDITEMREAERIMREQGRQLEAYFANDLSPLVFLNPQFNFLRVNLAYARACQRHPVEFQGRNHFELYPHAENEAIFREVVRTRRPYVAEARAFEFPDHPEWGVTYWDWTLSPVLDEEDQVDFLVFSLNDVTERVEAQKALQVSEDKLRYLSVELLAAQESERKRLAGELHDELGHGLLTVKLQLRSLERRLLPEQQALADDIESLLHFIDGVLDSVRRLYFDLSPGNLEELGLTGAVRQMIDEFAKYNPGIRWRVRLANLDREFPLPTQTAIYRIMQELLNNIGKHAQASQVTVAARRQLNAAHFAVEDNGRGFDVKQALTARKGLGLAAMEERLRLVGGSLEIFSQENRGTRVSFTIPLPPGESP